MAWTLLHQPHGPHRMSCRARRLPRFWYEAAAVRRDGNRGGVGSRPRQRTVRVVRHSVRPGLRRGLSGDRHRAARLTSCGVCESLGSRRSNASRRPAATRPIKTTAQQRRCSGVVGTCHRRAWCMGAARTSTHRSWSELADDRIRLYTGPVNQPPGFVPPPSSRAGTSRDHPEGRRRCRQALRVVTPTAPSTTACEATATAGDCTGLTCTQPAPTVARRE